MLYIFFFNTNITGLFIFETPVIEVFIYVTYGNERNGMKLMCVFVGYFSTTSLSYLGYYFSSFSRLLYSLMNSQPLLNLILLYYRPMRHPAFCLVFIIISPILSVAICLQYNYICELLFTRLMFSLI